MHETSVAALEYRAIYDSRSKEELATLALIKRFNEYVTGDPEFREALVANQGDPNVVMRRYGLNIDAELLRPLFDTSLRHFRYENADDRWPLARLWDNFVKDKLKHRDRLCALADTGGHHPRYDAWRKRQIRRCTSELGTHNGSIVHALASYELSRGCSVGCWFCGISADRFGGSAPYTPEMDALWRGVLAVMVDRFGTGAQSGFCYWATDPCDNPDYPAYIEAHYEVTGMLPQTTTAVPMRDVALTRRILEVSDRIPCITNRFSILTRQVLHRVFAEFTPMELLDVELVMQQKESLSAKSLSGRAIERVDAQRRKVGEGARSLPSEALTIACVSGFLINMPERKVRLASPTRSSERWPDGYRVYDEAHFENAEDFAHVIDAMVDRHMGEGLDEADVLSFRPDLAISATSDGFIAETQACRQTFTHVLFGRRLGELIGTGNTTVREVVDELSTRGQHVLDVHYQLQILLDSGLLHDDPVHGTLRRVSAHRQGLTGGDAR